jgi:hypothetical protein
LKSRFIDFTKVVFSDVQRPFAYLNHHFPEFVQIALLNAQNVENAFQWPFEIMKYRFIDITKVAFQVVQKTDYELHGPFSYLKHHLSDFIQASIFDAQDAKNEFV